MKLKNLLILIPTLACGWHVSQFAKAAETYPLRSAKPDGTPIRVVVNLEVGGHLKVAADKKNEPVPMSVVAQFGYDEQRLDDGNNTGSRLAVRWYDDVRAVIKAADQMAKPQLREDRQLIAVSAGEKDVTISSPNGPLTHDELDLVEIPANTLIVDELLPSDEVEIGHQWKPSDTAMRDCYCSMPLLKPTSNAAWWMCKTTWPRSPSTAH